MYSPDNIERSRASANCVGSYLHSTWWLPQAATTTFAGMQQQQNLGGLAGIMGGLGNSLGNLFGKP